MGMSTCYQELSMNEFAYCQELSIEGHMRPRATKVTCIFECMSLGPFIGHPLSSSFFLMNSTHYFHEVSLKVKPS